MYVVGLGCDGREARGGSLEEEGLDPDGPATTVGERGEAVVAMTDLSLENLRDDPKNGV